MIAAATHSPLLTDLGTVLICAGAVTLFFRRLRIPVFLGYLLAGFLVGPGLWESPPIKDRATVEALSEFGLIFLMFYLGMEFNPERLQRVLGRAFIATSLQTLALLALGANLAPFLGYNALQGLFLGGLLSISSSMVTVSVLKDLNRFQQPHAQMAVGVLLLEDVLAIILLVVLAGLAATSGTGGGAAGFQLFPVLNTTFLIGVFVVAVYFLGRIAMQRLVKALSFADSAELIIIAVVAMALATAMLAQQFGFSSALGAFLAGAVVCQTSLAHDVETAMAPLRNLFCAVFFVSIGMRVDPGDLMDNAGLIVLLSALVTVVKVVTIAVGLLLSGQPPRTAFRAAVAKAQIGEFSFVIVAMGLTVGVTTQRWMSIAVGVCVITAAVSLLLSLRSEGLYYALSRRSPRGLRILLHFYHDLLERFRSQMRGNRLWRLIRRPLVQVVVGFFLISALVLLASVLTGRIPPGPLSPLYVVLVWVSSALAALPFGTAIIRNVDAISLMLLETLLPRDGGAGSESYRRLRAILQNGGSSAVMLVIAFIYAVAMQPYLPNGGALLAFLAAAAIVGTLFWNRLIRLNNRLELLFMESFHLEMPPEQLRREEMLSAVSRQYPWEVDIREVEVPDGAAASGFNLRELRLREYSSATVVALSRGGQIRYNPSPEAVFFPGDKLYLFGNKEQNDEAEKILTAPDDGRVPDCSRHTLQVERILVSAGSELVDETLASLNLRRRKGVTVLGIQRGEQRITSPSAEEILHPGDILYAIGNLDAIEQLQRRGDGTEGVTRPPMPIKGATAG